MTPSSVREAAYRHDSRIVSLCFVVLGSIVAVVPFRISPPSDEKERLMEGSAEALLVAGTLVLTSAFLLGIPMARERMKAPTAPRHLVNTHLEGLMAGAALLGLSVAANYSTQAKGLELMAAWLLIGGVAASLAGGTTNWLMGTGDPFAARSPGFLLQAVSGPAMLAGAVLLSIGVLTTV
jgi:hypothetical protein